MRTILSWLEFTSVKSLWDIFLHPFLRYTASFWRTFGHRTRTRHWEDIDALNTTTETSELSETKLNFLLTPQELIGRSAKQVHTHTASNSYLVAFLQTPSWNAAAMSGRSATPPRCRQEPVFFLPERPTGLRMDMKIVI